MHIAKILSGHCPALSFEFFPPKSQKASDELFATAKELGPLGASYLSVTYGAGGSSRDLTRDLVIKLKQNLDIEVISHLTCVGSSNEEIKNLLAEYDQAGISNIMALRGDQPKGQISPLPDSNGPRFASDLVSLIRSNFPHMGIGVAGFPEGHPECPNRMLELDYLKRKIDAGADYICTQLFFENRDFYDFCERCDIVGIKVPIIAGIMPITSTKSMKRMAELALGARFPSKLMKAMARVKTDEDAERVGIHWATSQVLELLDRNVAGIHFYTLNRSRATLEITKNLGIGNSSHLREQVRFNPE